MGGWLTEPSQVTPVQTERILPPSRRLLRKSPAGPQIDVASLVLPVLISLRSSITCLPHKWEEAKWRQSGLISRIKMRLIPAFAGVFGETYPTSPSIPHNLITFLMERRMATSHL